MSDADLPADLRAILELQQSVELPTFASLPVLPPIGSNKSPKRSNIPEMPTRPATTIGSRPATRLGYPVLPRIATSQLKTAPVLYPIPRSNIAYDLRIDEIDENEILRPLSATSSIHSNNHVIGVELPDTFSDFHGVSIELDNLTAENIAEMLNNCRKFDRDNNGFVPGSRIIEAIRDSIGESNIVIWENLLQYLKILSDTLVDYVEFFGILLDDKNSRDAILKLPEALDYDLMSHLPSRPTSSQAQRERGRAQLLLDFENVLENNRDIDIERFKTATDKKAITIDEFRMLFQIYNLSDSLSGFEQRIIDLFVTRDKLFCFSAFAGCLDQLKLNEVNDTKISDSEFIQEIHGSSTKRC